MNEKILFRLLCDVLDSSQCCGVGKGDIKKNLVERMELKETLISNKDKEAALALLNEAAESSIDDRLRLTVLRSVAIQQCEYLHTIDEDGDYTATIDEYLEKFKTTKSVMEFEQARFELSGWAKGMGQGERTIIVKHCNDSLTSKIANMLKRRKKN